MPKRRTRGRADWLTGQHPAWEGNERERVRNYIAWRYAVLVNGAEEHSECDGDTERERTDDEVWQRRDAADDDAHRHCSMTGRRQERAARLRAVLLMLLSPDEEPLPPSPPLGITPLVTQLVGELVLAPVAPPRVRAALLAA
jgi:hypothetical protein